MFFRKKEKKPSLWQRFRAWSKTVPHFFAKCIIVHCIVIVSIAAYWSLYAQSFRDAEMAVLFGAIATPFVTELAMLLIKTIKTKKGDESDETDADQQDI